MTSSTDPKTIMLRGSMTPHTEMVCAEGAIRPGMLISPNSAGKAVPHPTAAGKTAAVFARENSLVGKSIDDNYVQGDTVLSWEARTGDWIYALIEPSSNVAIGALLESNGEGLLQAQSGNFSLARALEAVNSTGGPATGTRIRVSIL